MRRRGVMTVCCVRCLTPNGIPLSLHHGEPMTIFECYQCEGINRIKVVQNPVMLSKKFSKAAYRGVKVHGDPS